MLVIDGDFLSLHHLGLQGREPFFIAKAVISFSFFNQLFGVLHIDSGLDSLALYIGAIAAVLVRAFIVGDSGLFQRAVDDLRGSLHEALLIGILNTENKISALMLGNQIGI